MSIGVKKIKKRNIKRWKRIFHEAKGVQLSIRDYQQLLASIKEVDEHQRKLKKASGKTVTDWKNLDVFTNNSAFVPVYPQGAPDHAMYRSVNLGDMFNEVDYMAFMEIKARLLSKAETDSEYQKIHDFFDSPVSLT